MYQIYKSSNNHWIVSITTEMQSSKPVQGCSGCKIAKKKSLFLHCSSCFLFGQTVQRIESSHLRMTRVTEGSRMWLYDMIPICSFCSFKHHPAHGQCHLAKSEIFTSVNTILTCVWDPCWINKVFTGSWIHRSCKWKYRESAGLKWITVVDQNEVSDLSGKCPSFRRPTVCVLKFSVPPPYRARANAVVDVSFGFLQSCF